MFKVRRLKIAFSVDVQTQHKSVLSDRNVRVSEGKCIKLQIGENQLDFLSFYSWMYPVIYNVKRMRFNIYIGHTVGIYGLPRFCICQRSSYPNRDIAKFYRHIVWTDPDTTRTNNYVTNILFTLFKYKR